MSASDLTESPLIKSSATVVGTTDWDELDRELTPILTELLTLGPGNDQHPSVSQLFHYLMNPKCTGEEFTYVSGELAIEVSDEPGDSMYLTKVATETLATRSPVLTGSWEKAAWTLLYASQYYEKQEYGAASDQFNVWIIQIISDPETCPNPCLRMGLITLLLVMVDANALDRTQAIQSILSACSFLTTEYIYVDLLTFQKTHQIDSFLMLTNNNLVINWEIIKLHLMIYLACLRCLPNLKVNVSLIRSSPINYWT